MARRRTVFGFTPNASQKPEKRVFIQGTRRPISATSPGKRTRRQRGPARHVRSCLLAASARPRKQRVSTQGAGRVKGIESAGRAGREVAPVPLPAPGGWPPRMFRNNAVFVQFPNPPTQFNGCASSKIICIFRARFAYMLSPFRCGAKNSPRRRINKGGYCLPAVATQMIRSFILRGVS